MDISIQEMTRLGEMLPGNIVVYLFDNGLKRIYYSDGIPSLSGYTADEYVKIKNDDAYSLIMESDRDMITQKLKESIKTGNDINLTYRVKHKKHGFVWVHSRTHIIGQMDGSPVLLCMMSDVSQDTESYELLLDSTARMIFVCDKQTCEILYANNEFYKGTNSTKDTAAGKKCYEMLCHNDHRDPDHCPCFAAAENKNVISLYDSQRQGYYDIGGNEINWCGHDAYALYYYDVSEQKKKDLEIFNKTEQLYKLTKERENIQNNLINNIPSGITICEWDGTKASMKFINDGYCIMMGYKRNEYTPLTGERSWERINKHEREYLTAMLRNAAENKTSFSDYVRVYSKALEREKILHINGNIASQTGGVTTFFVSVTDVDELAHAREKLMTEQHTMTALMNISGMIYYEYDPINHTAVRAPGDYGDSLPDILTDYPECILKEMPDNSEYADRLRTAFKKMDEGSREETFETQIIYKNKKTWYNYHLVSIYGLDGRRKKISCTSIDITLYKEAVLLSQHHMDAVMRMNPNAISTFRLNLTQNICENTSGSYPDILHPETDGTVEGYVQNVSALIPDADTRMAFTDTFSRENLLKSYYNGEKAVTLSHRYNITKTDTRHLSTTVDMLRNPITKDIEGIVYVLDVTGEYTESAIKRLLFEKEYECVALINTSKNKFTVHSMACTDMCGVIYPDLIYSNICTRIADNYLLPEDREMYIKHTSISNLKEQLSKSDVYFFTINARSSNGINHPLKYSYYYLDEHKNSIVSTIEDVARVLDHDILTGVYNRRGFMHYAKHILENSTDDEKYAVIFFNIKGFKAINEIFGVDGGDIVLRRTTELVFSSELNPLAVARFEADHFVALLRQDDISFDAITKLCHRSFEFNNKHFKFYSRCGIYYITDKTMSISGMCDRAKLAKDYISDDYVKPYAVYNKSMRETFLSKKELTSDLEHALENKEFRVYYQPVYDAVTEKVVSAEALVRWCHPELGIISPGMFVPAFEENGYISELDGFVADSTKRFLETRHKNNRPLVPVAVNLSRMDFYDNKMMNKIMDNLRKCRLENGHLRFEVTESAYTETTQQRNDILSDMRALGAKIYIDDFGSGYSSFSTICGFHFDIIKLDMGFVQQIGISSEAESIIKCIITMAHSMNSHVIAEGVETKAQLEFLRELGCDYIQGYYFSKPLPENEFEAVLDKSCLSA